MFLFPVLNYAATGHVSAFCSDDCRASEDREVRAAGLVRPGIRGEGTSDDWPIGAAIRCGHCGESIAYSD